MKTFQTNALRIAELMGWKYNPIFKQSTLDCNTYFTDAVKISSNEELIELFSSYNGLMPIVFKCNADINYRIHIYEECVIFSTADGEMLLPKLKYELEHEFIEALQLAVIKYLELKNG